MTIINVISTDADIIVGFKLCSANGNIISYLNDYIFMCEAFVSVL